MSPGATASSGESVKSSMSSLSKEMRFLRPVSFVTVNVFLVQGSFILAVCGIDKHSTLLEPSDVYFVFVLKATLPPKNLVSAVFWSWFSLLQPACSSHASLFPAHPLTNGKPLPGFFLPHYWSLKMSSSSYVAFRPGVTHGMFFWKGTCTMYLSAWAQVK